MMSCKLFVIIDRGILMTFGSRTNGALGHGNCKDRESVRHGNCKDGESVRTPLVYVCCHLIKSLPSSRIKS